MDSGDPYGIPADNPFAQGGGRPEIWAYGLRNPWRFSLTGKRATCISAMSGKALWKKWTTNLQGAQAALITAGILWKAKNVSGLL